MNISKDRLDLELGKFFYALSKALEAPQLLPYMRAKIIDSTMEHYNRASDEEVKKFMRENLGKNV